MNVLNFIEKNQIVLGLLLALLFFVPWKKRRTLFGLRFIPCVIGSICISHFVPITTPYSILANFIVIFFIVWICFDCDLKYALFASTSAYCIQHITSKATYMLWRLLIFVFKLKNVNFGWVYVILLVINIFVLIPIWLFFTRHLLKSRDLKFDSLKILIASSSFIVVAVFLSYYIEINLKRGNSFLLSYCSLCACCILFAVLVLFMNMMNCKNKQLEEEKTMIERLLQKGEVQYEHAKLNIERINIRYHDLKHLSGFVFDEEERQKLDDEFKELQSMYYTGNKALDITLSEKALICTTEGVQFVCSVDGKCLNMLKPYHIYSLLGNAIDNAVECLKSVKEEDKRVLRLNIGYHGEMSIIHIQNYTPNSPIYENGVLKTTKGDQENHGFGIKSIKNIAESYGGGIYISVEDNVFNLIIMIPKANKK